ncbi:FtsK/SpoIIIE domain-containing protein [Arthrobacter sp. UYEF20]|uniref:FtsK/SpoIIIE domain-containing protein n=1 Tax=Arthrobacter sp. UYEF20 TaxID=1756363 RepID=UPI003396CEED
MIFQCTLVPAPGSALAGGPVELAVEVPAECSGTDLEEAISRRYGTGGLTVDGVPVRAVRVGDPPLRDGAVLVDGASQALPGISQGRPAVPPLLLAVHSGPGAGTIVPLRRARFRIGRSGTEIVLPDAELSREHALLDVTDSAVTIVDLHSANGTAVDGKRVREAVVTTGSVIRCGNSTMSLIFGGGSADSGVAESAGCSVAEPLPVRSPANSAPFNGSRATVLLTAVLPLVIGVGLALLTGLWMFLAFSLVSAASMLVPAVSGRRQRRGLKAALAAAAREDMERRRRSAPSAAELCAHNAHGDADGKEPRAGTGALWLRLGLAEQRANIRLEPADPFFLPPPLGLAPLTLDPAAITAVSGPEAAVAGLVRSFILQLAGYPAARRTRVLIHGSPACIPLAARFLPRVTLCCHDGATASHLRAGPGPGCDRGVLIILDDPGGGLIPATTPGTARAAVLSALAAGKGWQVIDCSRPADPPEGSVIALGGRTARLTRGPDAVPFLPDLVPPPVFERYCRRLGSAGRQCTDRPEAMAAGGALAGILPLDANDVARRWAHSGHTVGLPVPVGTGRKGTLHLDLQRDGPHVLVAGTTGSGKSEFLRTLAAALAATYPPDRINLLFVDFKGGSGLGPLTGLPHCVGMLSDLGIQEVDRTLVSLRAEVRRREQLLASAQARDLIMYRSLDRTLPVLPHLVIVVDEFRMLVDEAPGALTELMRIAAIGRSLGIHLVMATQRPQGSITADIRANVTSCVALRVQSGMESMDIMNSALAADIPIASPGRAFLARGTEAPEEFQTATLTPDRPPPAARTVTVLTAGEWLGRPPEDARSGEAEEAGRTRVQEAAALAAESSRLWAAMGGSPVRRPVAAPLPTLLPFPRAVSAGGPPPVRPVPSGPPPSQAMPAVSGDGGTVRLGWLDLPEQQCLAELCWHPADHGHLGLVGGAAGGADAALTLAVDQLLAAERESHLYILDAAGSFSRTAASARVGAVAGLHEPRRAVRVLERLAEEMTRRLSAPAVPDPPRLVLVLCGWGSWVSVFRSGPLARGEDLVQDIIRDGAKAGITVIVSGERELATARFFAGIANRIFMPAGSTEEGRLAWPRLPALPALPGRVAVFGAFTGNAAAAGRAGQLYEAPPPGLLTSPESSLRQVPFRAEALPQRVSVSDVLARAGAPAPAGHRPADPPAGRRHADPPAGPRPADPPADASVEGRARAGSRAPVSLCLGVGGDDLRPVSLTLPAGSVLAVLGGPSSGKTSLLAALPGLNPSGGGWLHPRAGGDPADFWAGTHAQARAGTLNRAAVLVADDLDLQSEETNRELLSLNSLGWTVILAAGFSPALQQRVPLAHCARSHGKGVLICPRSLMDGDLFGVRFELEASPPAGRAVVISDGQAMAVQLAADPAAGTATPEAVP